MLKYMRLLDSIRFCGKKNIYDIVGVYRSLKQIVGKSLSHIYTLIYSRQHQLTSQLLSSRLNGISVRRNSNFKIWFCTSYGVAGSILVETMFQCHVLPGCCLNQIAGSLTSNFRRVKCQV